MLKIIDEVIDAEADTWYLMERGFRGVAPGMNDSPIKELMFYKVHCRVIGLLAFLADA